jgi:hypothetical protein
MVTDPGSLGCAWPMLRSLRPSKKHASSVLGLAPEGFWAIWKRQFVRDFGDSATTRDCDGKKFYFAGI